MLNITVVLHCHISAVEPYGCPAVIVVMLNLTGVCTFIVVMLNITVFPYFHSSDVETNGCPALS